MLKEKEIFKLIKDAVKEIVKIDNSKEPIYPDSALFHWKLMNCERLQAYCKVLEIDEGTAYEIYKNELENEI